MSKGNAAHPPPSPPCVTPLRLPHYCYTSPQPPPPHHSHTHTPPQMRQLPASVGRVPRGRRAGVQWHTAAHDSLCPWSPTSSFASASLKALCQWQPNYREMILTYLRILQGNPLVDLHSACSLLNVCRSSQKLKKTWGKLQKTQILLQVLLGDWLTNSAFIGTMLGWRWNLLQWLVVTRGCVHKNTMTLHCLVKHVIGLVCGKAVKISMRLYVQTQTDTYRQTDRPVDRWSDRRIEPDLSFALYPLVTHTQDMASSSEYTLIQSSEQQLLHSLVSSLVLLGLG